MTDCRLEYMVTNPRVTTLRAVPGSSPTTSTCDLGGVAQLGEQRSSLVTTSPVILLEDILTAVSEYMPQKQVCAGSSPARVAAMVTR